MEKNTFSKKYHLIKPIGIGGMSSAYLAISCKDNGLYIIKKIKKMGFANRDLLEKISKMNFNRLPQIFEIVETVDFIYLIEEYICGISLDHYIKSNKIIEINLALHWFVTICNIISNLHKMLPYPVLHGDIKPENIIIQNNKEAQLIDYSNVMELAETKKNESSIFGTLGYAAPEIVSEKLISIQSEIYSIGATFYYVLTGKKPIAYNLEHVILKESIEAPLTRIIYNCIRNKPENRYESADQIIIELKNTVNSLEKHKKTIL